LSDAQREQVRGIMESHKGEFETAGTKLREAHRAFAEAVRASAIDEATVRTLSAAVGSAMADEAILRARVRAEVHALLTAEQLEQVKQREQQPPRRRRQ
jgi:protein CpxP